MSFRVWLSRLFLPTTAGNLYAEAIAEQAEAMTALLNEKSAAAKERPKVARAPRSILVLEADDRGVLLQAVSRSQSTVVRLSEPRSWIGWESGFDTEHSLVRTDRVDDLNFALVLRLSPALGDSLGGCAWAGPHTVGSIALVPGTVINFWPGRVEVVGL